MGTKSHDALSQGGLGAVDGHDAKAGALVQGFMYQGGVEVLRIKGLRV